MSDRKKPRLCRKWTGNFKIILRRLQLSLISTHLWGVESFLSSPPNFSKPLRINALNRARTNKELHVSPSGDAPPSWHFLLGNAASSAQEESVLRRCDAIVTMLSTTDRWMRPLDHFTSTKIADYYLSDEQSKSEKSEYPPNEAIAAIEATHRWASRFVRPSICALGRDPAWILMFEGVEHIVRAAGRQLELITAENSASCEEGNLSDIENNFKSIDASVAISFVILVPTKSNVSDASPLNTWESSMDLLPDFESFHDYFLDLEDRLLDECDAFWEAIDDDNDNNVTDDQLPDGCKTTIAAFHPRWKFNNEDDLTTDDSKVDVSESASPIDFEKRTPYPTISLVMSSAIDVLVEKDEAQQQNSSSSVVTERIAALNERTLRKVGLDKLRSMFETEVVCPVSKFKFDA
ncbi:hypothetical protein HJC23_011469 [Cyclotella cryptica]|uniref:Uncharacterized protein n=1 Tax=Cyclotella cryptica TaxID=29204 RepID=A0ABD3NSG4_9STRA